MKVPREDSQGERGLREARAENDAAILALADAFVAVRAYADTGGMCNDEASLDVALMLLACIEKPPALYAHAGTRAGMRRGAKKLLRWADQIDMREDVRRTLDRLPASQS